MMTKLLRAATVALTVLAACTEPTATTPEQETPPPVPKPSDVFTILPMSQREFIAGAGSEIQSPPSVKVYDVTAATPVAGATVSFQILTPDGATATTIPVVTSNDGIARLPEWKLGNALGRYSVVARLETPVMSLASLDFYAYVRGGVVAIYDLISLEGEPFPSAYASEAHYILFEDGSYNHVYNSQVDEQTTFSRVDGKYTRDSSGVISFYNNPLNTPSFFGILLSEGRPVDGKLRVTYSDFIDFDIEIYAQR
jgi:hypothetical protein